MKPPQKLDPTEIRRRVDEVEDFVNMPRYDNSLAKVVDAHPNGLPMRVVARAVGMTEDEAEAVLQGALAKLRTRLELDTR